MKHKPSYSRAVAFLRHRIPDCDSCHDGKLPSIKKLAKNADVSLVTMVKAVGTLCDEGLLVTRCGSGTWLASRFAPRKKKEKQNKKEMPVRRIPVWVDICTRVKKDILNSVWHHGMALPPVKILANHYKTSYRCLKKALDDLCREEILERAHRGYIVRSFFSGKKSGKLRIIALEHPTEMLSWGILNPVYSYMESELIKAGCVLEPISYRAGDQDGTLFFTHVSRNTPMALEDSDEVLGYILLIVGGEKSCDLEILLKKVDKFKKPVSIFIQRTEWGRLPNSMKNNRRIRLFPIGIDRRPGNIVAHYLLEKGHRKAAFLSPYHARLWSKNRFTGIQQTFTRYGLAPDSVCLVAPESVKVDYKHDGLIAINSNELFQKIHGWSKTIDSTWARYLEPVLVNAAAYEAESLVNRLQLEEGMRRLLDDKSITAWVCANDRIAGYILDFLHEQGVRVPADLSLLSFDNSTMAIARKMTSYDFNLHAVIDALIAHVLGKRLVTKKQVVQIEGHIVERMTIAHKKATEQSS